MLNKGSCTDKRAYKFGIKKALVELFGNPDQNFFISQKGSANLIIQRPFLNHSSFLDPIP